MAQSIQMLPTLYSDSCTIALSKRDGTTFPGFDGTVTGNRQGKRIVPAGRKDMDKCHIAPAGTELRPFRPVAFALHGRRNAAYDVSSLCLYLQPDWMCLSYHNSHVPTGGLAVGQGLNLERGPKAMKQYTADKIRNLALAGHGNAGKTSLAEAMLYLSGATDRLGKTAEGNTVCDLILKRSRERCR